MSQDETRAALEQRAAELRKVVEAPSEREVAAAELVRVEKQIAEGREAEGRDAAKTRLVGIRRALGSVVASMTTDEKHVREKVAELSDAIARLNERYGQTAHLKAEATALCDRFGLAMPVMPVVQAPALRDIDVAPSTPLAGPARRLPRTEQCEHGFRERRTYEEARGSEGYRIIAAAGLKPFPPLTERQQQAADKRASQDARTTTELQHLGQTAKSMQAALDAVPGLTGITAL